MQMQNFGGQESLPEVDVLIESIDLVSFLIMAMDISCIGLGSNDLHECDSLVHVINYISFLEIHHIVPISTLFGISGKYESYLCSLIIIADFVKSDDKPQIIDILLVLTNWLKLLGSKDSYEMYA